MLNVRINHRGVRTRQRRSDPPRKPVKKSAAITKLADQRSKVSRTMRTTFKATTLQFTQFMNDMYNLTENAKISKNAA